MNCKFTNLLESEVIATRDDIDLDTDHEALGTLKNELDLVTHQTLSRGPICGRSKSCSIYKNNVKNKTFVVINYVNFPFPIYTVYKMVLITVKI